jgi:thiol:disulfide interchange protein
MKLLGFLLLSSLFFSTLLSAGDLHWEKDLKTAFDKASATNHPLMVMVESKTCRWCIKMKRQTLADDSISTRLKDYVLVKIDRDEVESKFVPYAKYLPTIYFMTPEKKILETVTGYFVVLDFNSWIDDTEKKLKNLK